jgi:hypothetical protein
MTVAYECLHARVPPAPLVLVLALCAAWRTASIVRLSMHAGRAKSEDVIKYAESLFRKIKFAVAQQHALTVLKASFLDPVQERLGLEVSLELFARSDQDFMTMFTAPGVLASLTAKRDMLAKRVEGLLKCKNEFAELARCL